MPAVMKAWAEQEAMLQASWPLPVHLIDESLLSSHQRQKHMCTNLPGWQAAICMAACICRGKNVPS